MQIWILCKYCSVHHTDVPPITEVISAKGSDTYFREKVLPKEYHKTPIHVNFSSPEGTSPYNNASDERHVKFKLEDDIDIAPDKHCSIPENDTKEDSVITSLHPE